MPGMTHWKSSHFHAYYPIQSSFPSVIGDVIANGLAAVPFSWVRVDNHLMNFKQEPNQINRSPNIDFQSRSHGIRSMKKRLHQVSNSLLSLLYTIHF